MILTASHTAPRAQLRSEGGVRIQSSASILAAIQVISYFLEAEAVVYLNEGRHVVRLSSTPWLTLTPAFTKSFTRSPLNWGSRSPLTLLTLWDNRTIGEQFCRFCKILLKCLTNTLKPKFLPSPLLFGNVAYHSAPLPSESTTSGACPPRTCCCPGGLRW